MESLRLSLWSEIALWWSFFNLLRNWHCHRVIIDDLGHRLGKELRHSRCLHDFFHEGLGIYNTLARLVQLGKESEFLSKILKEVSLGIHYVFYTMFNKGALPEMPCCQLGVLERFMVEFELSFVRKYAR